MGLFIYVAIPMIRTDRLKKIRRVSASTIVVMKGLDMTAGSKPSFLAKSGSVHPTNLAIMIVKTRDMETTRL